MAELHSDFNYIRVRSFVLSGAPSSKIAFEIPRLFGLIVPLRFSVGQYLFIILSRIALTIALVARPFIIVPVGAEPLAGARGTLVSFVPAKGALLVAADSRSTTLGVRCDGRIKLAIPANPPMAIVAGTGASEWISARVPLWPHDPCGDLDKNGVTFLDAKALAVRFLEQKNLPIWRLDLSDFANYITKAIIHTRASARSGEPLPT
ncbi:hypothetical protein [Bradyrhizobium sp. B117]|uniref:hypothetical protein n=1 Tax=Bradyrhizobium sp. B117 TaxID=3140246 RepID=UPI0031839E39